MKGSNSQASFSVAAATFFFFIVSTAATTQRESLQTGAHTETYSNNKQLLYTNQHNHATIEEQWQQHSEREKRQLLQETYSQQLRRRYQQERRIGSNRRKLIQSLQQDLQEEKQVSFFSRGGFKHGSQQKVGYADTNSNVPYKEQGYGAGYQSHINNLQQEEHNYNYYGRNPNAGPQQLQSEVKQDGFFYDPVSEQMQNPYASEDKNHGNGIHTLQAEEAMDGGILYNPTTGQLLDEASIDGHVVTSNDYYYYYPTEKKKFYGKSSKKSKKSIKCSKSSKTSKKSKKSKKSKTSKDEYCEDKLSPPDYYQIYPDPTDPNCIIYHGILLCKQERNDHGSYHPNVPGTPSLSLKPTLAPATTITGLSLPPGKTANPTRTPSPKTPSTLSTRSIPPTNFIITKSPTGAGFTMSPTDQSNPQPSAGPTPMNSRNNSSHASANPSDASSDAPSKELLLANEMTGTPRMSYRVDVFKGKGDIDASQSSLPELMDDTADPALFPKYTKIIHSNAILRIVSRFDPYEETEEFFGVIEAGFRPYCLAFLGDLLEELFFSMSFLQELTSYDRTFKSYSGAIEPLATFYSTINVTFGLESSDQSALNNFTDIEASQLVQQFFRAEYKPGLIQRLEDVGLDVEDMTIYDSVVGDSIVGKLGNETMTVIVQIPDGNSSTDEIGPLNENSQGSDSQNNSSYKLHAVIVGSVIIISIAGLALLAVWKRKNREKIEKHNGSLSGASLKNSDDTDKSKVLPYMKDMKVSSSNKSIESKKAEQYSTRGSPARLSISRTSSKCSSQFLATPRTPVMGARPMKKINHSPVNLDDEYLLNLEDGPDLIASAACLDGEEKIINITEFDMYQRSRPAMSNFPGWPSLDDISVSTPGDTSTSSSVNDDQCRMSRRKWRELTNDLDSIDAKRYVAKESEERERKSVHSAEMDDFTFMSNGYRNSSNLDELNYSESNTNHMRAVKIDTCDDVNNDNNNCKGSEETRREMNLERIHVDILDNEMTILKEQLPEQQTTPTEKVARVTFL